jgi:hypothetical protein
MKKSQRNPMLTSEILFCPEVFSARSAPSLVRKSKTQPFHQGAVIRKGYATARQTGIKTQHSLEFFLSFFFRSFLVFLDLGDGEMKNDGVAGF